MKASRVTAPGQFVIENVADPKPRTDQVLIESLFVAICGSDIYVLHHMPADAYPKETGTTGHEMVGVVRQFGSTVTGLEPGELVLGLSPDHTAMSELYCAQAENSLRLPQGRTPEEFLMAQQLGTVIYACRRLPDISGKTALVVGQGSAGLFFNSMLKRLGAKTVIATDLEQARLDLSASFGADRAFINGEIDPVSIAAEMTGGELADIVVEATGEPDAINLTPKLVKERGVILFFGVPHQQTFPFDYFSFYRKYAHTITNSGAMGQKDKGMFVEALDLIAAGDIPAGRMITHRLPFDRLGEAYSLAQNRTDGAVKVIVEMPGAPAYRNKVIDPPQGDCE
jgi:threonine dehydrogenase-like Zn-dependent dehydrogenase